MGIRGSWSVTTSTWDPNVYILFMSMPVNMPLLSRSIWPYPASAWVHGLDVWFTGLQTSSPYSIRWLCATRAWVPTGLESQYNLVGLSVSYAARTRSLHNLSLISWKEDCSFSPHTKRAFFLVKALSDSVSSGYVFSPVFSAPRNLALNCTVCKKHLTYLHEAGAGQFLTTAHFSGSKDMPCLE